MALKIVTNNQFRPVINSWELTEKERKAFDYYNWEDIDNGEDNPQFFRYKGELHDLGKFKRIVHFSRAVVFEHGTGNPELLKWGGIRPDSYFSGLLVKYSEDYESVKVGYFTS